MATIFVDTEFTDFSQMQLISVGLVSEDGLFEFYAEIDDHNPNFRSAFVQQVVMPLLNWYQHGKSHVQVAVDLSNWINALPYPDITFIVDYPGDAQLLSRLLNQHRSHMPITFEMLNHAFFNRVQQMRAAITEQTATAMLKHTEEKALKGYKILLDEQDKYFLNDPRQHHALVDARALRHGWLKGLESTK